MPKRHKLLLLIILSLISVLFAEVIAGSMPYPLLDLWGYVIVIPLYGLHTILFLSVIFHTIKQKRVQFRTLYFAGVLFGLYEAYVTKVLWVGLADDAFIVFGLSLMDFIVLVFFWHPLMSFIIPSLIFERLFAIDNRLYLGLPNIVRSVLQSKVGLMMLFLLFGLFSSFNGVTPGDLLVSFLTMGVPTYILIGFAQRMGLRYQYTMKDIMPSKIGLLVGGLYLLGIYLFTTFTVSFEAMTFQNQLVIWIIYGIFGWSFYRAIIQNNTELNPTIDIKETSYVETMQYFFIMLLSGPLFVFVFHLLGIKDIVIVSMWVLWTVTGLVVLIVNLMPYRTNAKPTESE